MKNKFFSQDSWLVACFFGIAGSAIFFFTAMEGPIAENLGLIDPYDDQYARVLPMNAKAMERAPERSNGKAFGPFAYGEYQLPPDGEGVFSGELVNIVEDDFEKGTAQHFNYIYDHVTGIVVEVKMDGTLPPGLAGGAMVRAKGNVKNGELTVNVEAASEEAGSITLLEPATVDVNVGETRQVIALLANNPDKALECSNATITDILFGANNSVRGAFESASHGDLTIAGVVEGPFDIPNPSSDRYTVKGVALRDAALAAGVSLSGYDHIIYVFPQANGHTGNGNMPGQYSWISQCNKRDFYQHELGHNLGLGHAGVGTKEYADKSSFMGYGGVGLRHGNAHHMEDEGWLAGAEILNNPGSGTFTLSSSDISPAVATNPQAIRFNTGGSFDYYLSFRTPNGYADRMPAEYDNQGQLHTSEVVGYRDTNLVKRFTDGISWSDTTSGVTITQVSHVPGESATFEVTTQCITNSPTVTISPSDQGAAAGDSKQYTAAIRNNNSSGCGAGSIALSAGNSTAGLTTSVSQSSVNLAPGASTNVTLTATSDATIAGGSHTMTVTANSGSSSGSDTATYTIDNVAPSIPRNLSGSSKRKQVNLTWNASTDNVGVAGYEVLRNGAVIGSTPNTAFADRNASNGDNSYQVRAYDDAGNRSSLTSSVTVNFKGGGGKDTGGSDGGDSGKPEKCSPWPSCR